MAISPDEIFLQFSNRLEQLKDWPDRDIILSLTKICEDYVNLAQFFVEIVVNKLIHVNTNPTYKRPLFYLIDAIMKHVGGAYPAMFTTAFHDIYQPSLVDLSQTEREKLDFLLGTWAERRLLPLDLIDTMRAFIATAPRTIPQHLPMDPQYPPHMPPATHHLQYPHSSNHPELVEREMNHLLVQMMAENQVRQKMTLEDWQAVNPNGYIELQRRAEGNVIDMYPSHGGNNGGGRQGYGNFNGYDRNGRGSRRYNDRNASLPPPAPVLSIPHLGPRAGADRRKRPLDGGYDASFHHPQGPAYGRGGSAPMNTHLPGQRSHHMDFHHSQPVPDLPQPQHSVPQGGVYGLNIDRVCMVRDAILSHEASGVFPAAAAASALHTLATRLDNFLASMHSPATLPPMLLGPLPLEPLFAKAPSAMESVMPAQRKIPTPQFVVVDLLTRRPDGMVRALYGDRPHQFYDDGLRFRTLQELQDHTNKFLQRKILASKKQGKEVREYRELYCTIMQWVTDFNELNKHKSGDQESSLGANKESLVTEEFITPADEKFPRCPVSKEKFETYWDNDEGELMYKHAVKVLVTEAADSNIFNLAAPIPDVQNGVKYIIVHQLLVLNKWLQEGRAVTLKDAILRYENIGPKGLEYIHKMKAAAGEDEQDDDIFVLLELAL
eukprot:gene32832-39697_t